MGSQDKVVVEYTSSLDVIYLHTNFPVVLSSREEPFTLNLGREPIWSTDLVGEEAVGFKHLLVDNCREVGLKKVIISQHQITLIKGTAFEWEPIQRRVFAALFAMYPGTSGARVVRIGVIRKLWTYLKSI